MNAFSTLIVHKAILTPGLNLRVDQFYFTNSKADIVHKFEINLSVYVREQGFSVLAMHPYVSPAYINEVRASAATSCRYTDVTNAAADREMNRAPFLRNRTSWNPTHYFWRTLIEQVLPAA